MPAAQTTPGWPRRFQPDSVTVFAGGHGLQVLLQVYAKCISGRDEIARRRIEAALDVTAAGHEPGFQAEPEA